MALTTKSNGSSSSNIIQASWFNDFYNLFTGGMSDQPILFNNGVMVKAVSASPTAPTLALVAGTSLGIGAYTYAVSFGETNNGQSTVGQSLVGTTATITTTANNQVVSLTAIPTGPSGTTSRYIYRSKVNTTSPLYLVTQLNDNTTTAFTDSVADASLGAQSPTHGSFGGYLMILGSGGSLKAAIYNDGAFSFDSGSISSDGLGNFSLNGAIKQVPASTQISGSTSGTATLYQVDTGTIKRVYVLLSNFRNGGGSTQTIAIPTPFITQVYGRTTNFSASQLLNNGSAITLGIITSLSSGGGSQTSNTTFGGNSFFEGGGCSVLSFNQTQSTTVTGMLVLEGV